MSSEPIAPSSSSLQGQYAGFVTRFIAILVDMLLVAAAVTIFGLTATFLLQFFNLYDWIVQAVEDVTSQSPALNTIFRILAALGTFYFLFFLYYVTLLTSAGGMTIGKALMGVRVVRMEGIPLTVRRSTRRYITFWLAALPLFLGLLWVIIDDRRQGWHDKLSGTCVIYDWPAQEDERFLSGLRDRLRYAQQTRDRPTVPQGETDLPAGETADAAA